jgi:endonuclease G
MARKQWIGTGPSVWDQFSKMYLVLSLLVLSAHTGSLNELCPLGIMPLYYFLPQVNDSAGVIYHNAFILEYSDEKKVPVWVAYILTRYQIINKGHRSGVFAMDPAVLRGTARPSDYRKTGYDRGHQVPARDFTYDSLLGQETFYMSNICPQEHTFNAGAWESLESQVRVWADTYEMLYVVTGPVNCKKYISKSKICVPEAFFKVVLANKEHSIQSICFLMKHKDTSDPLSTYTVSLDSVEKVTNIRFFSGVPDSLKRLIRTSSKNILTWDFISRKRRVR